MAYMMLRADTSRLIVEEGGEIADVPDLFTKEGCFLYL
jgi:hypothetical protein